MTFQEILEGITRERANTIVQHHVVMDAKTGMSSVSPIPDVDLLRKIDKIEWALQAIAEELRDREQEFKTARDEALAAVKEREEDFDDVDEAFDEYEKRK